MKLCSKSACASSEGARKPTIFSKILSLRNLNLSFLSSYFALEEPSCSAKTSNARSFAADRGLQTNVVRQGCKSGSRPSGALHR